MALPCGKCPPCISKRISSWSFRLMQEDKNSYSSLFITLTYATSHLPITQNGFKTVQKSDLQNFIKRLRQLHQRDADLVKLRQSGVPVPPIKYFAAAEYGSETKRPHYHLILLNCRSRHVSPAWGLGDVHFGQVNEASIGYTLKYLHKPPTITKKKPLKDDRIPEFQLMSKELGKNYLGEFRYEKYPYCNINEYRKGFRNNMLQNWPPSFEGLCLVKPRIRVITCSILEKPSKITAFHRRNLTERMYCNLKDGQKITMPRYYKNQIYHEKERKAIGAHARILAEQKKQEAIQEYGSIENYWAAQAGAHLSEFIRSGNLSRTFRNKI